MCLEEWQSWGNIWQVQISQALVTCSDWHLYYFVISNYSPPKQYKRRRLGIQERSGTRRHQAQPGAIMIKIWLRFYQVENYDQNVKKFYTNWKMDPCSDFKPDFKWFGKPLACRSALPQDLGSGSCSARHSLREFSAARFENRFNQVSKIRI